MDNSRIHLLLKKWTHQIDNTKCNHPEITPWRTHKTRFKSITQTIMGMAVIRITRLVTPIIKYLAIRLVLLQ